MIVTFVIVYAYNIKILCVFILKCFMDITNIINEEINTIFERTEYGDNDIINPSEINLQHEYDKFNAELFSNQLPKVPLKWGARKRSLGHVHAMINRRTGEASIDSLTISTFHAMPYQTFKNTLVHEMIHIKQLSTMKRNTYDPHGYMFNSEARRINHMGLGFNITIINDAVLDVSDTTKQKQGNKEVICIILKIDNKPYACTTSFTTYKTEFSRVVFMFHNLVDRGKYKSVELIVVETRNTNLLKLPNKRTFKSGISYAPITDELYNELLKDKVIQHDTMPNKSIAEENHNDDWEEIIIS